MLPDELQHQQLVEIGIKQGSDDWVQFPVVVVCPLREVHDHRVSNPVWRRRIAPLETRSKTTIWPQSQLLPSLQLAVSSIGSNDSAMKHIVRGNLAKCSRQILIPDWMFPEMTCCT